MPVTECLKLGNASEFTHPQAAEIAKLAGKSDELDTCDIRVKYGDSVLLNEDILTAFNATTKSDNAKFENAVAFYKAYPTEETIKKLGVDYSESLYDYLSAFFSLTSSIRQKHDLPAMIFESGLLLVIAEAIFDQALVEVPDFVLNMCADKNIPSENIADLVYGVASMFMGILTDKPGAKSQIEEIVATLIMSCEEERTVAKMPPIAPRLTALSEHVKNKRVKIESAEQVELSHQGSVKVGEKLNVPSLAAKIKGKKAIIFGWSQYCPACHKALTGLNKFLGDKSKDRPVFIGAVPAGGGDLKKMKAIQAEAKAVFDNVVLTEKESIYMPSAYPYFIMVNADGSTAGIKLGWSSSVEEWLNEGGKW